MAAEVAEQPNDQSKAGTSGNVTAERVGKATGIRKFSGGIPGTFISYTSLPASSINFRINDLLSGDSNSCPRTNVDIDNIILRSKNVLFILFFFSLTIFIRLSITSHRVQSFF